MKYSKSLTIFTCLFTCLSAHADFISGDHQLSNGKQVALQGLEWMPLTYTNLLSRNVIETGFTDNLGNQWGKHDWRYATRLETEALINSLWGGTYSGWADENAAGANWFLSTFGGLAYDRGIGAERKDFSADLYGGTGHDYSYFIFGAEGDCYSESKESCFGHIGYFKNYDKDQKATNTNPYNYEVSYRANSGPTGRIHEAFGLNGGFSINNFTIPDTAYNSTYGHLLVRNQVTGAIDMPSTKTIFLLPFLFVTLIWKRHRQM